MRIFFCINNLYSSGGGQKTLTQRVNYLKRNHFDLEIYLITTDQKRRNNFYNINQNIKIIDTNINYEDIRKENILLKMLKYKYKNRIHLKKMNKLIQELKPDIIVAHGGEEKWIVPKLNFTGKKILENHISKVFILQRKQNYFRKIISYLSIFLQEKLIKKYDEVIVLNEIEKKLWKDSKIKVIPNPLPFYSEKLSNLENKIAISVGRLEEEKGYDALIDIWEKINQKHEEWILEIYGEGSLKEELENKIKEKKLEKTIKLKGICHNIKEKYLESSIYLMTSKSEAFPLVLLEAMNCGLPIISFDCPFGPRSIITEGIDGYLCEMGNIEEMTEKINFLIENKERRKLMGKNARINSLKYKEEEVMEYWNKIFIGKVK